MATNLRLDLPPALASPHGSGKLRLVWYTDPHSIWCWGCEPAIRRVQYLYPDAVDVEVRMGGLFEDFTPMREYWTRMSGGRWKESVAAFMEAVAGQHRMPMNAAAIAGNSDDFNSTWPACIAVKAAERQGRDAGWRYLRGLREGFLLGGRPIHRREVQVAIAAELGLDAAKFTAALDDGAAERAFREDLSECRTEGVQGFPTFVIQGAHSNVRIEGYQPWEAFEHVLGRVPSPAPTASSALDFLGRYPRSATREVATVFGLGDDEAEMLLDELAVRGGAVRREVGGGLLWDSTLGERAHQLPSAPERAVESSIHRELPQD